MGLKRILILLRKDLAHGPKGFLFMFALVAPVLTSLVLSLLFGRLLVQSPRLGILDEGQSQLAARVAQSEAIDVRFFDSDQQLRRAVETGQVEIGITIPAGFEQKLQARENIRMGFYVWGEGRIQNRMAIGALISNSLVEVLHLPVPVDVVSESLGSGSMPWFERLLPLLVLMAVLLGGMLVPASSLVEEKTRGTLRAVTMTPASVQEVFAAKAALGIVLSMAVALIILVLNRAWSAQPGLLVLVLLLSALLAALFGLLLGTLAKDVTSLLGIMKGLVLVLYAPGIIQLFPQIPLWVAKISPTYYMFNPIVQIAQEDAGWAQVKVEVMVLVALIVLSGFLLARIIQKKSAAAAY